MVKLDQNEVRMKIGNKMYLVEEITDRISILGLINVPKGTGDLTTFINPILGDKIAARIHNSLNRFCNTIRK